MNEVSLNTLLPLIRNVGVLVVITIIIIITIMIFRRLKTDKNNAEYRPTYLFFQYEYDFSEKERILLCCSLALIGRGVYVFSPHQLGVYGVDISSTYYQNLYNKGCLDKPERGKYCLNKSVLANAYNKYLSQVSAKIQIAQNSKYYKNMADNSIEKYKEDLSQICILSGSYIPSTLLLAYLANTDKQFKKT